MNKKGALLCTLVSALLLLIACGSSDNDDQSWDNCSNSYVAGSWLRRNDETSSSITYSPAGEYARADSINCPECMIPPFVTVGTYQMGKTVTLATGVIACEVFLTLGIGGDQCPYYAYVDEQTLYQSDCGSTELDFSNGYYFVD